MKKEIKNAIETYQCCGCVNGSDISCFNSSHSSSCSNHVPGTMMSVAGKILLGLCKGFNRIGDNLDVNIFETFEDSQQPYGYEKFNIPVWKHLDEHGNTLIRGLSPRINRPFLDIILGDVRNKINCLEITNDDLNEMD